MGRFVNKATGVTLSVDDSKDGRYAGPLFKPADAKSPKTPAQKVASSKSKK